jgi:hypothetical protein
MTFIAKSKFGAKKMSVRHAALDEICIDTQAKMFAPRVF